MTLNLNSHSKFGNTLPELHSLHPTKKTELVLTCIRRELLPPSGLQKLQQKITPTLNRSLGPLYSLPKYDMVGYFLPALLIRQVFYPRITVIQGRKNIHHLWRDDETSPSSKGLIWKRYRALSGGTFRDCNEGNCFWVSVGSGGIIKLWNATLNSFLLYYGLQNTKTILHLFNMLWSGILLYKHWSVYKYDIMQFHMQKPCFHSMFPLNKVTHLSREKTL